MRPGSTTILGGDPRFGMQAPIVKQLTTKMPSGLTRTITASRGGRQTGTTQGT